MKVVHGPGPYFDGPSPWTRSTEGVHGPGVNVLYFPVKCKVCNYLIMIMELKITIIVYLYFCLVAAAVVDR